MSLWSRLSHSIGKQQEQNAKSWLQTQGLNVIHENYHCKGGEIDLIALDSQSLPAGKILAVIVFVEVKFRKNNQHGDPLETVTPQKQRRLQKCAQNFLLKNSDYQNHQPRFDVIAITGDQPPVWLQNAF